MNRPSSFARANNDTADTTWDNLRVSTVQVTTTVFSDDFSSDTIDPSKYTEETPFFEGGTGKKPSWKVYS